MSQNLPPGVTPADIDRHFGGPTHEHEWEPVERDYPILEDMAAIFHERCVWAEVVNTYTDHQRDEIYYEYGRECDETRWRRFDLAYVTELTGEDHQELQLVRDDIDQLEEQGSELFDTVVEIVIEVEQAFPNETEIIEIDPDQGQVVIRHDGYELGYGPGVIIDE